MAKTKKNKKFHKRNFIKMIEYTQDPKNEAYMYHFLNIDDNKESLDRNDFASLAFAHAEYDYDTSKSAKHLSKQDINKSMIAKFINYATEEISNVSLIASILMSNLRDLNLDGSYPNETDLEHRIRSIIKDELNKSKNIKGVKLI